MSFNWDLLRPQLQAVLDEAVSSGQECGCQFAIYEKGQLVADLAAGFTGEERKIPVASDTLFPLFSTGKALLATAVHQAVEKGLFSYETRLAELWPEFGNKGKEKITVEHVLSHRGGLHILPHIDGDEDLADWEKMTGLIARMTPRTLAGRRCTYHPVTFAYLAGEVLQRARKRPLREILQEGILRPCGIENEFFFGTDEGTDRRMARIDESELPEKFRPSWHLQMMGNPVLRHACIPSFNAMGSARALARFYAFLGGQFPEKRLISEAALRHAVGKLYRQADDPVPETSWAKFGLGYVLGGPVTDRARLFGHGGAAGAEGFYDWPTGLAVGFAKNRLLTSHPCHPVRNEISRLLGLPERNW